MAKHPFLPLFVQDHLTSTRHLTCAEFGAYDRILCMMWAKGGTLPNDRKALRLIAGCSGRDWARLSPAVMAMLTVDGDTITHPRIQREWQHVLTRREQGAAAGRKSAQKRTIGWLPSQGDNPLINNNGGPTTHTHKDNSCSKEQKEARQEEAIKPSVNPSSPPSDRTQWRRLGGGLYAIPRGCHLYDEWRELYRRRGERLYAFSDDPNHEIIVTVSQFPSKGGKLAPARVVSVANNGGPEVTNEEWRQITGRAPAEPNQRELPVFTTIRGGRENEPPVPTEEDRKRRLARLEARTSELRTVTEGGAR
jgi:uncharacterized protein YdaU (DUF1376 family)